MAHKLPPLRFGHDALEPYIDAETMELHHDAHHGAYVDNLNKTLAPYPELAELTIEDLLGHPDRVPDTIRAAVRNNGGGHANHQLFWDILAPSADGTPKGAIADAITRDFGSFERFQSLFADAAARHFGSGWAFLVVDRPAERLKIVSLPNQDSVLGHGTPALLCCDVWEHAYYLKYRNRRPDYLAAWWKVVAWDVVDERLRDAMAGAH
jgi:Fe-Mn family superoxide dismutase